MASTIKVDKIEGSTGSTITVPTGQTLTVTDGIPVASGGTGLASFTQGDILYATGATTLVKLAKGTGRQGLQTNSGATAPEWANSPQSLMTAAGDVLYASGANVLAKLAKGSDDDVLTLASGIPSWAAAAGGGKIGQVLQTVNTGTETLSSATPTTIPDFTVTITPVATSSKILVMVNALLCTTAGITLNMQLFRDTTNIYLGDTASNRPRDAYFSLPGAPRAMASAVSVFLDSPSSTSALDYSCKWFTQASTLMYMNRSIDDNDYVAHDGRAASSITVMEVLA